LCPNVRNPERSSVALITVEGALNERENRELAESLDVVWRNYRKLELANVRPPLSTGSNEFNST